MRWETMDFRTQRALRIFAQALKYYTTNHTPEERAKALFPDAPPEYQEQWTMLMGLVPFAGMSEDTVARYIQQVLEKYGEEATRAVDMHPPLCPEETPNPGRADLGAETQGKDVNGQAEKGPDPGPDSRQ